MADPTSDTPMNTPEDVRPRATIKLKPMTPPTPAADAAAPAGAAADATADAAAQAEPAIHITPSPASVVPGVKQTIRLRPPTPSTVESGPATEVKPAIKIVPKAAETPTGIPTANPVESAPAASPATIQLKKPESSTPTVQLKKPESSSGSTIQLKKPESSTSTIQLKKPESSTPTVQLKKPEQEASPASAPTIKKVGESPIPPERKLTLKLKNQPSQPKELPKNIIPGLKIPNMPPQAQKPEEKKDVEATLVEQPPVAAPVETPTPVPEAVPEDKKKKGKLPKVKKQKDPVTSADEPNWFFLTLSILTLICVCFIAYLLFAQYMNMYQGQQIPVPGFLMPK